ncbi:tyrosine-type recombinase/integrase [Clostridium manihotivorum]|uniref:Integrase n=1 Tax=Clostridium manihotivorum TaxID=2320868 RepID=A0A3R5U7M3_9CLOT|nr:site-specific integrase [Clostridium manihotivorum]QAA33951.1 hypothetical protein C1I91_21260 [Clostridium manihotivorum]
MARRKIKLSNEIISEVIPVCSLTIAEVQELFDKDNKERGLRTHTIKFYREIMNCFYKFVDYKTNISEVTKQVVEEYIVYMKERGLAQNTIHTNIRGLRTFLYFAMREEYIPQYRINVPTPSKRPLETYEEEEVVKLLVKPDLNNCSYSEYIAYVATNLFVYTGARLNSILHIRLSDIDLNGKQIYFTHTKNGKPHTVPLASPLYEPLKEFIAIRKKQGASEGDRLLTSVYCEELNEGMLQKYIKSYNKSRGVDRTSIHAYRRFYIKSMVLNGVPIPKIQYLVQHSTADLISHYTKLYSSELIDDVEQFASRLVASEKNNKNKKKLDLSY